MKPMILVAGVLVGGVAAAVLLWRPANAAPPKTEPPKVEPAPVVPTAPEAARADVAAPEPAKGTKLAMPDGTEVEPLNGVKNPATLTWGDTPYSPIIAKEFNNGIDWYKHADGSMTTTVEVWRSDLGRKDPVTLCCHPTKTVPTDVELESAGNAPPPKKQ